METPDEPDLLAFMAILQTQVRSHYRLHKHIQPRFYLWHAAAGELAVVVPWEWDTFEEKHAKRRAFQNTARKVGASAVGVVSESWYMEQHEPPGLTPEEQDEIESKYTDRMHLEPNRQEGVMLILETRSAQLMCAAKIIRKQPLNERSAVLRLTPWVTMPADAGGDVFTFRDKVKA